MGDGPSEASSAREGILETKGCGHESEKPCSRLLSADTFDAAPWFESPRSNCRDYALPSRTGNSQLLGSCGPLVLCYCWRGSALHNPFRRPATDPRFDATAGRCLRLRQQEGRDDRSGSRGGRAGKLSRRTDRTDGRTRPAVRARAPRGGASVSDAFPEPAPDRRRHHRAREGRLFSAFARWTRVGKEGTSGTAGVPL